MNKGMICALTCCMMLAAPLAAQSTGEIYKVVDEDGNVTFTDQRPSAQAQPMDLPPLSVIETDIPEPAARSAARRPAAARPTAAHPAALDIKMSKAGLSGYFQQMICADELGRPKEDVQFWNSLEERLGFERQRTLFADDNVNVLNAARSHGIRYLVHIAKPSSRQPARYCDEFTSVSAFDELIVPSADPITARRN